MSAPARVLLVWEAGEVNSWNPVLAERLEGLGHEVTQAHGLAALRELDLGRFDACLPRFRCCAAHMRCADELLVRGRLPMLNGRDTRIACEDKGLAHLAFEERGLPQPRSFVLGREGQADREDRWDGETLLKPLAGSRGSGIEVLPSLEAALARGRERREDLLVQQLLWPARSWRVIVGREAGVVDPYWRRPASSDERVLSISTGARIEREPLAPEGAAVAQAMLEAVDGDLLAVDLLETESGFHALEINHNFDAHGATEPALGAFEAEIARVTRAAPRPRQPSAALGALSA